MAGQFLLPPFAGVFVHLSCVRFANNCRKKSGHLHCLLAIQMLDFTSLSGNQDDEQTIAYLMDTARQTGILQGRGGAGALDPVATTHHEGGVAMTRFATFALAVATVFLKSAIRRPHGDLYGVAGSGLPGPAA